MKKVRYFPPKIKIGKISINLFLNRLSNEWEGDLFATYCGQCEYTGACWNCILPPGCDLKSC
jgi:hypothetical protein